MEEEKRSEDTVKTTKKEDEVKKNDDEKMDVDSDDEESSISDPNPSKEIQEKVELIIAETKSTQNLTDGIEQLLYIEKKQRQADEEANTIYVAKQILLLCFESSNIDLTIEQISILSRRRSQFRRVVMRIVQFAMTWIELPIIANNKEIKLKLINILRQVSEGKIYLECERARLTKKLSEMKEKEKNGTFEACEILQELQIETFGSMKKKEKCEFFLEQFRLNLATQNFIRAAIVRNKITSKIIRNLKDLEQTYWNLSLILFYHSGQQFLELCKSYLRLKDLLEDTKNKTAALKNAIYAIILAKYNNEQNDLLHRILKYEVKLLENLPVFKQLLILLTTKELIAYPLNDNIMNEVKSFQFIGVRDENQNFNDLLHDRIIQHNLRIVAEYYNRISMKRLSEFLRVDEKKAEFYLSELVTDNTIYARIDRINGIIRFKEIETPNAILNDWRNDTGRLLELIDLTCHQIHKEIVTYKK